MVVLCGGGRARTTMWGGGHGSGNRGMMGPDLPGGVKDKERETRE